MKKCLIAGECTSCEFPVCWGPSPFRRAKTPAILEELEFKSQRELDFPLVVRQLSGDLP
jgi:hypothetical protein